MISWFHLLWICPIVFTLGFGICAVLAIAGDAKEWQKHNKE